MNILAVDIGNTNITIALFVKGTEKVLETFAGGDRDGIAAFVKKCWDSLPIVKSSKDQVKDGIVAVCSVKPDWTKDFAKIVKETLNEKIKIIGQDIDIPMETAFKDSSSVGKDRLLAAMAAYEVAGQAVLVADFGTAVTIDLVDDKGKFLGGVILPGFELSASALNTGTALLPKASVKKPKKPFGQNTNDAIAAGLYYSAVGTLQEMAKQYADYLGQWPQTVVTGSAAELIKQDCDFIDSFVDDLVVKGIAIAYNYHCEHNK